MLASNKINPIELGVVATFILLLGAFLLFVIALSLFNEQNAKQSAEKNTLALQIQNLQEQLALLQRKL
jgi:hypothetical protein